MPIDMDETAVGKFQIGSVTADSVRLQDFYCNVLGLRKGPDTPIPSGGIMRSCFCGNTLIKFSEPASPPSAAAPAGIHRDGSGMRYFSFGVRNARAVYEELKAAGCHIPIDITENERRIMFFVQDPDGNNIEIGQVLQASGGAYF
jgi:catechol 2,3-dioxygenase-like lactoylglutathione lyase family enzyme